jgi:hypothetical protein
MPPAIPLVEFSLRLEPTTRNLVDAVGADSSRKLSFPFSTSGNEGPPPAGFACPLRSALRVWLPSRRFPPFEPVPALFHAGSAHGILPSELSPPGRHPQRSHRRLTHLPFPRSVTSGHTPGSAQPIAVPGLSSSRESLTTEHVFSASAAGCSLGIHSSRAFGWVPCPGFIPGSSHVLGTGQGKLGRTCTSECRSTSTWPRPNMV